MQKLRKRPVIITPAGAQGILGDLASIRVNDMARMLQAKSQLANWIYVDLRCWNLKSAGEEMQPAVM